MIKNWHTLQESVTLRLKTDTLSKKAQLAWTLDMRCWDSHSS
jgi:hypothetical protein